MGTHSAKDAASEALNMAFPQGPNSQDSAIINGDKQLVDAAWRRFQVKERSGFLGLKPKP